MSSFTPLTFSANGHKTAGERPKNARRRLDVMAFLLGMLLMFNTASSQIIAESGIINEICPSCTSGDVRIEKVLLVDAAGVPVTASCTPGALMSNLYLQFNLNVISQERYGFLITGDLYVNNQFIGKIYQCYAQTFTQGRTSVKIDAPISFNCGQPIEIRNAFTAWSQSAPTVPGVYEVCNRYNPATNTYDCAALSPKCYQYPYNIRVVGPLVSDFSFTSDCTGSTGVQTVQFTDKTTGGELAYTYAWDFGDGTTSSSASPLKTYATAGSYVVTLKVTDGIGQVNSRTQTVLVGRCCSFSVTAPTITDLGNFNCSNFNTIPAIPTSLAQLKAAPYNVGTGAYPCGTLRFTVSDNMNAVQCSASEQNVTRTIMIYDDLNNDGIKGSAEPSETIVYSFKVSSSVPSAPSATGASRCGAGSVVLTASGAGVLRWYDGNGNLVGTGSAFETPSISETTTYYVSSLDCCESAKTPVVATVNAAAVAGLSGNSSICAGSSSTLTATGGSSYLWSNGATTSSITVSPAETTVYSVEVSTPDGCKDTKSMTLTVNPMPVINIAGNAVICFGGSTVLTASGGASYKWSNGATTASIEVSPAVTTTYTVEVETAAACKSSKSVTVLVNDKPEVVINGTKEICAGEETTLTASGGASFAWSTGVTTQSITVKPGATTTYSVVVTSGANCQAEKSVQVVVNPLPVVSITENRAICYGDKITLTASGGTSYKWSNGATTSSIEVKPEQTTTYTVEVTSSKGCSSTASTTVTVNPLPVVNIEGNTTICFGGSTVLTASGGAFYKWSNGATTASVEVSPSATTTYSVEVTTAAGCKGSKSVTVLVNDKPEVVINGTKEICAGEETTLTASGGASFAWSNGATTQSITVKPGATTTYSVVVTSGANCQAEKSVEVVVNPLPVVSITENRAICYGDKITLTASGGASYKWSNGATTSSIEVKPEQTTTYTVEVTSSKGCSSTASTTVTVNPLPIVNIEGVTTICFGGSTVLTASGGASYKWSNGATTASIEVNPAATTAYQVEVTTDKGCVSSGSVTVTVNPLPVVNIDGNTTICFGGTTVLTATGGVSYKWSNGSTSGTIQVDPKSTTEYTVEVTTDKGCVAGRSVNVTVNPLPEISISGNTVICYGGSTTLTASGGAEYLWNTGATTASITVEPSATTEYSVTVTTDKGCVDSKKVTVVVNDKPVINISGTTEICFGQETTLTASGGANFKWSTGETTASIKVKPNSTTLYNVEVTSGDNCRDDKNVEVIVNALPEARLTESREICFGDKITLNATGGDSYRWININKTEAAIEVSPKETTEYTVEVISAKGCISTRKMKLTVNELPVVKVEGDRSVCYGLSTTLTASGGVTYNWSQGSDANSVTVSPRANTTYTVEVISEQGCSVKQEVAVAVQNCGNFCTYTQYSFGTHYENERYVRDNNCVTDKSEATIEYAISKWPNSSIRIGEGRLNIRSGDAKWIIAFLPHAGQSTPMNSYPTMERLANDASVKNNLLAQTIVLAINMGLNEPLKYFSLKGGYMRTEGLADCGVNGNRDGRISHFFIDKKGLADVDGEPGITVNDVYMIANMYLAGKTYNDFNIHTVADIVETLNKAFEGCRSFKDFTDKAPEIGGKANYLKVYPNPFVSFVNFEFVAPEAGIAEVEIWDMSGRLMSRSTLGNVAAQEKITYRLSTNNLSYGQYIYRLKVGNWMEQGKLIRFR